MKKGLFLVLPLCLCIAACTPNQKDVSSEPQETTENIEVKDPDAVSGVKLVESEQLNVDKKITEENYQTSELDRAIRKIIKLKDSDN